MLWREPHHLHCKIQPIFIIYALYTIQIRLVSVHGQYCVWSTADARKSPARIRFKYNLFLSTDRTVGGRRQVHLGRPIKAARAGEHGYSVQTRDGSDWMEPLLLGRGATLPMCCPSAVMIFVMPGCCGGSPGFLTASSHCDTLWPTQAWT